MTYPSPARTQALAVRRPALPACRRTLRTQALRARTLS